MPNPPILFPASFASASAIVFANPDNSAQPVSAATPLPVSSSTPGVGNPDDSAADSDSATTGLVGLTKRLLGKFPAALGQRTMAQSLAVTLPADLPNLEPAGAPVTGTAMPAGGTGLTGWLSAIYRACSDGATQTGSASAAATIVSSANAGYMGGSFHVTSAGTGCTVSYEQSNDNVNWVALPVISAASATAAPSTTSTVAGIYAFATAAAFVRARVSTYGSGTVTAVLSQKQQAVPNSAVSLAGGTAAIGSVTVSGSINTGQGFFDTNVALAAGATFTGTARANSASQMCYFNATATADQAGTLLIDQSHDTGATWSTVASQAVAANGFGLASVRVSGVFGATTLYRVRYVNGATAQGSFRLSSSYTAG